MPREPLLSKLSPAFLELVASRFRVLSDPCRLAILKVLMDGEQSVTEIVDAVGTSQANVSKHLRSLTDAGFLGRRRQGLHVLYRIEDPMVEKLCALVCESILEQQSGLHSKLREAEDALGKRTRRKGTALRD